MSRRHRALFAPRPPAEGDPRPQLAAITQGQPWDRPVDDLSIDMKLFWFLTGVDHFGELDLVVLEQLWLQVREPFLAEHAKRQPGTRPYAWWRFEASEPRRLIEGFAVSASAEWFGAPAKRATDRYESQAAYLARLNLLFASEAAGQFAELEPLDPVTRYARRVVDGQVPALRLVRGACQRHLNDLASGHHRGLVFDRRAVARRLLFDRYLRHYKGQWAGKTFESEPWQQFCAGSIFGWQNAQGLRRFRVVWREVPRKNGKTFCMAGDGLYLLLADGEPGAEIYCAATKKDQALIAFRDIDKCARKSSLLRSRLEPTKNRLDSPTADGFCIPVGKDADTLDGLNPQGALIDEVHAHPSGDLWNVLADGMGSRQQPLLDAITTAGFAPRAAGAVWFGWEQHRYFSRVVDPDEEVDDDRAFVFIAGLESADQLADRRLWFAANPNLGVSLREEDLAAEVAKAELQPSSKASVLAKRFNLWPRKRGGWLARDSWAACTLATDPVTWRTEMLERLAGHRCFGGLDLAATTDLVSLVLYFPDESPAVVIPWYWLPADRFEELQVEAGAPYSRWEQQGFLLGTPGEITEYKYIVSMVLDLHKRFRLEELGYDPWNGRHAASEMAEGGVRMVEVRQNFANLSAPTKALEAMVIGRKFDHGGNPILAWNAVNASLRRDPLGNVMIDRQDTRKQKIDGIAATIIAIGRSMFADPAAVVAAQRQEALAGYERRLIAGANLLL